MPGMRASDLELALEVGKSDLDITHGHVGVDVSEEFHEHGEADAGTQHLRGISVSKLVRNDGRG